MRKRTLSRSREFRLGKFERYILMLAFANEDVPLIFKSDIKAFYGLKASRSGLYRLQDPYSTAQRVTAHRTWHRLLEKKWMKELDDAKDRFVLTREGWQILKANEKRFGGDFVSFYRYSQRVAKWLKAYVSWREGVESIPVSPTSRLKQKRREARRLRKRKRR